MTPSPAPFDIKSITAAYEAQHPEVVAKRLATEKAAADKAAYDALPYATKLQQAKDKSTTAQKAFDAYTPAALPANATATQKAMAALPGLANLNNPNRQAVEDAKVAMKQVQVDHLRQQLEDTSKRYGYSWKGNKDADFHAGNVANMLADQGVTDLANVKYDKTGHYLMNSETGNNLNWYKSANHPDEGPLANEGQIGWSAKGTGLTNYYVQKDAAGNPVFYPRWKDESPGGLGGFLLQAAPAIVGFATGQPELAALTSAGIGVASGKGIGDIIKGAAINAAGQGIGNLAANAATGALPMLGNAATTNAVADTLGGAAAGATKSVLSGQGLSGALPGAITAGVTSGVQSLAQGASGSLQKAGVSPTIANTATNIGGGGLANYIASGGNLNAALSGATNAAIGSAGQLAGQAVGSMLPPGVVNNIASGVTNAAVSTGANQLINSPSSQPQQLLSQHIAAIDPRLLQRAAAPVTNNAYLPSTVSTQPSGLTQAAQINQSAAPGEYVPTGFRAPVKSLPTTGLTSVTDPATLKKLGLA
jgi:hypothetical protein